MPVDELDCRETAWGKARSNDALFRRYEVNIRLLYVFDGFVSSRPGAWWCQTSELRPFDASATCSTRIEIAVYAFNHVPYRTATLHAG